jgi:hypothetical protein
MSAPYVALVLLTMAQWTGAQCALAINHLTPELNPSAQRCLARLFTGDFNFKGLTAPRFYKSFGVKGLRYLTETMKISRRSRVISSAFPINHNCPVPLVYSNQASRGSAFKKQAHGDITNHPCTEDHLDPSLLLRYGARSILRRHESLLTVSDRDPDEFNSRTYPYRIQAV